MSTTDIIQLITAILSPAIVGIILATLIKSQQDQMNAMKANMESMKAVLDMIKIDEIEKYNDRKAANAVTDALGTIDETMAEESLNLLRSDLKGQKMMNELIESQQVYQKYASVVAGVGNWLKEFPKADRRRIIEEKFPENATEIKEFLKLIL